MGAGSDDIMVSWLPLYHDMGLIAAWLGSLYFAAPFFVMSPLSFLARPESWLWAIHRFRATLSAAPNFAFERCVSRIDDSRLQGPDLSSLRFVANGAEPVSVSMLWQFIERFGAASVLSDGAGLRPCREFGCVVASATTPITDHRTRGSGIIDRAGYRRAGRRG
jgi:acyl-CoA synthetase (AMP-forming)/AMP-acid ligase II